jgi:hypothetical protein
MIDDDSDCAGTRTRNYHDLCHRTASTDASPHRG